nr:immunoglobulin light chain junction region [Macaca mulatta]MOY01719.1 immunoglobulin light chain junction region [Macaca mulatta]
CVQVLEFPWTF